MKRLLCKRKLGGLFVAALTAGTLCVSAVSAQTAAADSSAPKKVHKAATTATGTHAKTPASVKASKGRKKIKKVKGQAAPTPDRISEIQDALAKKGALTGTPSGKWDDSTVDAMKKFQSDHGLNPSGKLDALTLQKLGLGSETAGLAPPNPPPNSMNRLRNQTSQPQEPAAEQ
jgi:peptidoglycan hydrolase-like protein with peptidoglycan-binding domain